MKYSVLSFENGRYIKRAEFESYDDAFQYGMRTKGIREFQIKENTQKMYAVYKESAGGVKHFLQLFTNELDAADFCDVHGWEWCDEETRFVWSLDYCEV